MGALAGHGGGAGGAMVRVGARVIAPPTGVVAAAAWPGGDYPVHARPRSSGARRVPASPATHPDPPSPSSAFRRCRKRLPQPVRPPNPGGVVPGRAGVQGDVAAAVRAEADSPARAGGGGRVFVEGVLPRLERLQLPQLRRLRNTVLVARFVQAPLLLAHHQNRVLQLVSLPRRPVAHLKGADLWRGGVLGRDHRGCHDGGALAGWALRRCWKSVYSLQPLG